MRLPPGHPLRISFSLATAPAWQPQSRLCSRSHSPPTLPALGVGSSEIDRFPSVLLLMVVR
eukprot:7513725-Heterocapsa_arctica.AAC.1